MIVTVEETGFRLVTQADHARLAAEMLRLCVNSELVDHPRRALLLDAVARHDDGWWEADAAPRVEPASGAPLDFRAVAPPRREEIWRAGVERHAARAPHTAALAAAHALRLARRSGSGLVTPAFAEELAARRDELVASSGLTPSELDQDLRWLTLADALSLAAATGDASFLEDTRLEGRVTSAPDATTLELAPFPLAGTTRFDLAARRIERRPYPTDRDLGAALTHARWTRWPVRVTPPPPSTPA